MNNRQVLVTGADGFIGSHVTEALVREGLRVRAFVQYNSFNSWGWLDRCAPDVSGNFEVFAGDVRDPNGVRTAMKGCDAVLHLAALIAIPYSYHSPDTYVDTNVKGTLNVVQAARDLGVSKVVHTSTSEVYGTAQFRADYRRPSAPGTVAVFGQQDRRGSDRDVLPCVVRDARRDPAAVQHLRSAAIGAGCTADDHYPDRVRPDADRARSANANARLQLRRRHGSRLSRGVEV